MNSTFWKAAAERAVKTAAQSALLMITADQINAFAVNWIDVVGFTLGGAVLSILTSVASHGVGDAGPSLTSAERLAPPLPSEARHAD